MESNTVCCSSCHPASATPLLRHWYIDIIQKWLFHLTISLPTYLALDIPVDVVQGFLPLGRLGISDQSVGNIETTRFVVLAGTSAIVTGLITTRLLLVRRHIIKIMGECLIIQVSNDELDELLDCPGTVDDSTPYLNIVAMLIESYALDSTWSLATAVSTHVKSSSSYLFVTNDSTVKVCNWAIFLEYL